MSVIVIVAAVCLAGGAFVGAFIGIRLDEAATRRRIDGVRAGVADAMTSIEDARRPVGAAGPQTLRKLDAAVERLLVVQHDLDDWHRRP